MINNIDRILGEDKTNVSKVQKVLEAIGYKPYWTIEKYGRSGGKLDVVRFDGNLLLNEGINELTTLLAGGAGTAFSNANAYLGVGDDNTAEAATQTGLQAATNKLYKAMEAGFPTYGSSQEIAFKSSFGSSEANWNWREFTVANGNSDSSENLNRKVSDQGTKASGQTWDLTLTITFS